MDREEQARELWKRLWPNAQLTAEELLRLQRLVAYSGAVGLRVDELEAEVLLAVVRNYPPRSVLEQELLTVLQWAALE